MSDKDEAYGKDEPPSQDKIFVESENHSLNGLKLQPYTVTRQWAADAMGIHYGHLTKADIRLWNRQGIYPSAPRDTAIVLWLCTIADNEAEGVQADELIDTCCREPLEAVRQAREWAEKHNYHTPKRKEFWPAYREFLKIMREVHLSTTDPETEKKTEVVAT